MSIYKSRQVSLDKEPWVSVNHGGRGATALVYDDMKYAPRPEFEPTRDPLPYACTKCSGRWPNARIDAQHGQSFWAPRREQFDTQVNRVLVDVRAERGGEHDLVAYYDRWELSISDPTALKHWSVEEIDHARKVLTRLASCR